MKYEINTIEFLFIFYLFENQKSTCHYTYAVILRTSTCPSTNNHVKIHTKISLYILHDSKKIFLEHNLIKKYKSKI